MTITDPGTDLRRHLPEAREAVRWKLDGLPDRDLRRPPTPTGTNLLGPAEHPAGVELLCLGRVLVHLIAGTERHAGRAGHADVVRELIDGGVGHRPGDGRMPETDDTWWARYRERAVAAAGQN
ncbi:mycothiol transferase [Kitasatospora griseola]|uniref:mycothiol transferase n=1 Tax=Kitasatospora griseola TaxID=2064 RepID=UPI0036478FD9